MLGSYVVRKNLKVFKMYLLQNTTNVNHKYQTMLLYDKQNHTTSNIYTLYQTNLLVLYVALSTLTGSGKCGSGGGAA